MHIATRLATFTAFLALVAGIAHADAIETKSIWLELPPGWTEQPGRTISARGPSGETLMLSVVSSSSSEAPIDQVEQAAVKVLRKTVASPSLRVVVEPTESRSPSGSHVTEAQAKSTTKDFAITVLVVRGEQALLLATIEGSESQQAAILAARNAVVAVRWK
jgi:hypothetical protein